MHAAAGKGWARVLYAQWTTAVNMCSGHADRLRRPGKIATSCNCMWRVWVLRFMLCWTLCCIAYMLGAHGVGSNKVWACKSLKKKATSFCAWCSYGGSKVVPFVCGIPIVYRTAPVGDLRLVFPNALLNCNLPSFTLGLSMLLDQTC